MLLLGKTVRKHRTGRPCTHDRNIIRTVAHRLPLETYLTTINLNARTTLIHTLPATTPTTQAQWTPPFAGVPVGKSADATAVGMGPRGMASGGMGKWSEERA